MSKHRLCLLGDSHAAALLMGWRLVEADYPDIELQVFATPGGRIKDTGARGRAIVARKAMSNGWLARNGVDRINIDDYDGLIVVGYGTSALRHVAVLRQHVLFGYGRRCTGRRQFASPAALSMTVFDRLIDHKPFRWARRFRRFSGRPVFYIPTPRCAANVTKVQFKGRWPFRLSQNEMSAFASCVDHATEALCADIGMTLLSQPSVTLQSALHTRDEYRRDNDTSPIKRKAGMDPVHMNGEYGKLVWRTHIQRILAELEAAGPRVERPRAERRKLASTPQLTPP